MIRLTTAVATLTALALSLAGGSAVAEDPAPQGGNPKVKLETSLGDIIVELNADKAPISTLNFIQYTDDKFYDGTVFHRVISNFMIQGGGYTPELDQKSDGLRSGIKNEWRNGLKNNRGTIAMARLGGQPDSATAQFFINVVDNGRLDQPQQDGAAYAVFGHVVEGMDVVDKIRNTAVTSHPKYPAGEVVPVEPVIIKSVRIMGDVDRDAIRKKVAAAAEAAEKAEKAAKAEQE